jgi:hypothetical protein
MNAEFLDFEWHIFKCTRYKLTWYLKELEVCQDFDLRHRKEGRKENSNPKKRERELYSRLKRLHWKPFCFLVKSVLLRREHKEIPSLLRVFFSLLNNTNSIRQAKEKSYPWNKQFFFSMPLNELPCYRRSFCKLWISRKADFVT